MAFGKIFEGGQELVTRGRLKTREIAPSRTLKIAERKGMKKKTTWVAGAASLLTAVVKPRVGLKNEANNEVNLVVVKCRNN